jgi:hypothetical protein
MTFAIYGLILIRILKTHQNYNITHYRFVSGLFRNVVLIVTCVLYSYPINLKNFLKTKTQYARDNREVPHFCIKVD